MDLKEPVKIDAQVLTYCLIIPSPPPTETNHTQHKTTPGLIKIHSNTILPLNNSSTLLHQKCQVKYITNKFTLN